MPVSTAIVAAALTAAAPAAPAASLTPAPIAEHQRACAGRTGWSDPAPPIRIHANVYDVGTCGIVVLLVAGPAGHILIDSSDVDSAPLVLANLRRLGVRPTDVKLLLASHEHIDHVGGMAALRRATGAALLARAPARPVLESGTAAADDPQRTILPRFPGVPVARTVRDGEVVRLGPLRLTAIATPGHTLGGTSWTWRSCGGTACRTIVYADSLSAVAGEGYRFTDHPARVATLRATIAKVARLPCDMIVTPHPDASALYARLAGSGDRATCATYAAAATKRLNDRLASETAGSRRPSVR